MSITFTIGDYVEAIAGHDSGKYYVILQIDSEYVYVVDGKIRTLDCPKKKKPIHVRVLSEFNEELADKVRTGTVRNEEIKRAIKLLQSRKSD